MNVVVQARKLNLHTSFSQAVVHTVFCPVRHFARLCLIDGEP